MCDCRGIDVTNIVIFSTFLETFNEIPFSHSILNKFWSTRSQMIDDAVSLQIMKKKYAFVWEFKNFERKVVLCLGFLRKKKHQSEANTFWRAAKHGSHLPMIFKFFKNLLYYSQQFMLMYQ